MSYRLVTLFAAVALAATTPALAQNTGLDRRMERIEQSVRALQATVLQAQATGQPVVVRPEGPDPEFNALQNRVADLEQTLQRVNGQLEMLTLEIEQASRNAAAAEADRRGALQAMSDRMGRIETQLAALSTLVSAEAVAEATSDLTGATAPATGGTLNGQAAAPAAPANATEAFTQARALFTAGDHEAAGRAFEDLVARYPTSTRAPEAFYWLGESYFARRGYQTATAAYASALRNNPTTAWAPAAMARLAQSLANSNQAGQACAALAQFDQQYAARASAAVKANAQTARTRARCG
jgi:tol-pal system protein YbgF